jgi:integrase
VFEFRRQKTGALITIALQGDLAAVVDKALADPWVAEGNAPFLHTRQRKGGAGATRCASRRRNTRSTESGRCSRTARDKAKVKDFGLRDLRAKGATDMYLAKIPIRDIQTLLGHTTESTTRIYIKSYLGVVVEPNMVPIVVRRTSEALPGDRAQDSFARRTASGVHRAISGAASRLRGSGR